MPSVLIFGASGMVGSFLLPLLIARDDKIFAISREPPRHVHSGVTQVDWRQGDLFAAMPSLPLAETIYSLGPLDAFAAWAERVLRTNAFQDETKRIVALSSMSAQSKQDSVDAAERELAGRLRTAEAQLMSAARQRGVACTIFRPTLIYGAGSDRSLAPIARFAQRWRVLPVPYGASGLRQPVHAADLAAACMAVRDNAATFGKTYELGGGERLRFDILLARIARGPPRLALPLPLPLALARAGSVLLRGHVGVGAIARLTQSLIADNGPAARDFGYAPRPFEPSAVLEQNLAREGASNGEI